MIRAKLSFAAEAVVQDHTSNMLSAFNLLEGIVPLGLPLLMPRLSYFVLWERDLADQERIVGNFRVTLDNQDLATGPVTVDFLGRTQTRTVVYLNNVVFPRPGTILFNVTLTNGVQASYAVPIEAPRAVVAQGPPAAAQAPPAEGVQG